MLSSDLHFFPVLADHLDQPGQQVGHGQGGDGLTKRPEHLEGASGVVTGGAAQCRLQRHVAELLLQVEIYKNRQKNENKQIGSH